MKVIKSNRTSQWCGLTAAAILLLQTLASHGALPWAPVYATDFTTDPGWTTSTPSAYHWNADGTYTLTMADASGSYATTPIALRPHDSFKLEFDIKITRMDWAGNVGLGLYCTNRIAYSGSGYRRYVNFDFGNGDLGNGINLSGYDALGNSFNLYQYPSPWALNTWYHATATFDYESETLTVMVKGPSGAVLWSTSQSGIQDFEGLVYFGASKIGDDYSPGATGAAIIDNVSVSQPGWIPLYTTDFTTDPGWATSNPSDYRWNSISGDYKVTMADGSGSYATAPVLLAPDQSFKFVFDIKVSRMDWCGNVGLGLYGVDRHAYHDSVPNPTPHPYLKIDFANGDLGNGIAVDGFDVANRLAEFYQYPSSWVLNTAYRAVVVFDKDSGTVTAKVIEKSSGNMVWAGSQSGCQSFGGLVYFGASKVGDNGCPGAIGGAVIDNVGLYESPPKASIRLSQVEICWPSRTNAVYNVQCCSSLTTNVWVNLITNVSGTVGNTCVQDAIVVGQPQRLYRVQVVN